MNRNIHLFASALAISLAAAGGAEAASVYILEGGAGEVLVIDAAKDVTGERWRMS